VASETVTVFLGGEPTLDDLATALDALRDLLNGLATEVRRPEIAWTVDALEKSSALLGFRGVGPRDDVEQVTRFYLETAAMMRDHKPIPSRVRQAADRFLTLLDERVPEIRFETADDDVTISNEGVAQPPSLLVAVPPPGGVRGAVEGRVQTLSNRGSLRFTLYDLRYDKAVSCYLKKGDEDTMRDAWGRVAVVEGIVKRDPQTGRPRTIRDVSRIRFVEEGHKGDWRQAEGALRGISSDEPAESVIRRLRDAQ
jgi:hypothetical protein